MNIQGLLSELKDRNEVLFYFGLLCILSGCAFLALTRMSSAMLDGVSVWYKPFKFAFSIGIYAWTMAWYCNYLTAFNTGFFSWFVVVCLGFEIGYIALQAGKGERSHFNNSTPLYSVLYSLMALAATAVTVYTAYIGFLFFNGQFPALPPHYVTAIRLSIVIFVIFSLEGFLMGARMSHTIGGPDGGQGIPLLNWSRKFGDPRVAHFIGMHALQILPFAAYYFIRNNTAVWIAALLYLALAALTLLQALNGRSSFPRR